MVRNSLTAARAAAHSMEQADAVPTAPTRSCTAPAVLPATGYGDGLLPLCPHAPECVGRPGPVEGRCRREAGTTTESYSVKVPVCPGSARPHAAVSRTGPRKRRAWGPANLALGVVRSRPAGPAPASGRTTVPTTVDQVCSHDGVLDEVQRGMARLNKPPPGGTCPQRLSC
ncbi:hypothetical protein KNE206_46840 [Kitasatospora sp. NE20-6]